MRRAWKDGISTPGAITLVATTGVLWLAATTRHALMALTGAVDSGDTPGVI